MAWKAVTLEIGTVVVELQKPLGASSIQSSRTIRRMQSQSRRLLQKLPLPTMVSQLAAPLIPAWLLLLLLSNHP